MQRQVKDFMLLRDKNKSKVYLINVQSLDLVQLDI